MDSNIAAPSWQKQDQSGLPLNTSNPGKRFPLIFRRGIAADVSWQVSADHGNLYRSVAKTGFLRVSWSDLLQEDARVNEFRQSLKVFGKHPVFLDLRTHLPDLPVRILQRRVRLQRRQKIQRLRRGARLNRQ